MQKIKVALVGNPNSGKTTLFNALTRSRQHVGNYPGVTVEKKEGVYKYGDTECLVVDLPGTYSLTAYSEEELVARHYVTEARPDVVVDVLDASNLERSLYLAVQLMELNVPLVLAFNMSDLARQRGIEFDLAQLEQLLGVRIVETVGHSGQGLDELKRIIIDTAVQGTPALSERIHYGADIERELDQLTRMLSEGTPDPLNRYPRRWLALKLLENDDEIVQGCSRRDAREFAAAARERLRVLLGDEPGIVIADRRYGFISGACSESVRMTVESRHNTSDMIDRVLLNKVMGLPIFALLMYLVFRITFAAGEPLVGALEFLFARLGGAVASLWPAGSDSVLRSLIVDGIIGGVGGVLTFVPNIFLLFVAIAILELSGYMARAAFLMDRIMHKIGLHGKSFIPMLIGFGCSVPAILATRVLENRRNRFTTIMVIPLMSCGARLPIYTLIISAFFASHKGLMLWLIYIIGIILAVIAAKILRGTVFRGETIPYVMELPPYRIPTLRGIRAHVWQGVWLYVRKAGTIILGISILLWALGTFPGPSPSQLEGLAPEQARELELRTSIIGRLGHAVEPLIRPMGFDWRIGTALIGAVSAKEVFVAQMGIVLSLGERQEQPHALREELQARYSPLVGFCVMLFTLIGTPCIATVAATRQETRSWKWAFFQFAGLTLLAYIVTTIVYQTGQLILS